MKAFSYQKAVIVALAVLALLLGAVSTFLHFRGRPDLKVVSANAVD